MFYKLKNSYVEWRYRLLSRGIFTARIDDIHSVQKQLAKEGYSSQCGQDKWILDSFFPGKRAGVFVDIGANDGVTFSNTVYLEKRLGWSGVAVEPIPEVFSKLQANRACSTVNACVGATSGNFLFRSISGYSEMLSGLVDEYDVYHLRRVNREIQEHQCPYQDIKVRCYTLNELLEEQGLSKVDFLTIDVEGAEVSIIKNLDESRFRISVIGIENNYKDYRIPAILKSKGFRLHSIVGDEFYVNEDFMRESLKQK